jgi:aspartate racemase
VISILPAVDAELRARGLERVGLLGTRITMESKLFGQISGAQLILPGSEDLDRVHETYLAMASSGTVTDSQRELLFAIGANLCNEQGADAVLLAGTDLFLAFDGYDCGFDAIDGALVHVDAIHRIASEQQQTGEQS